MTKFQKQMLTIAAAGALTAVTALPAMAFENEFHGLFNFNTVFSNYNNGTSGDISKTAIIKDKNKMNNYFEQRARIQYIAKASDDLKMVTQFEINNRWGKTTATLDPNTGKSIDLGGNDLDADGLNIVTKHVYLDFNVGKSFNTKIGIMPYKDTIKGVFIDADLPAIYTTTKMGGYTLGLGFSRFDDAAGLYLTGGKTGVTRLGDKDKDLFILDNTFALNKDTKLSFSYYLLANYYGMTLNSTTTDPTSTGTSGSPLTYTSDNKAAIIHTFGLSGETKMGPIGLSGFAAMQAGSQKEANTNKTSKQFNGWAANVAATVKAGPGAARTGFLFTSGNNSQSGAHDHGWANSGVQSYNESGLMILTRNTGNSPTSTDQYIRRVITNQALFFLGYGANFTEKLNADAAVGMAWAPASFDAPKDLKTATLLAPLGKANASDYMGTEIALTVGYKLYKNLQLQAQAGYMINGGYYKNSILKTDGKTVGDPENPYTMRLQARYNF